MLCESLCLPLGHPIELWRSGFILWISGLIFIYFFCRYIYFPCSRRQFGLPGPSLLEIDHDERPEDGTLASSLAVNFLELLS